MRGTRCSNADSYNRFDVVSPLDGSTVPAWVIKPEFRGQVGPARQHQRAT